MYVKSCIRCRLQEIRVAWRHLGMHSSTLLVGRMREFCKSDLDFDCQLRDQADPER
jgi:hypothetical protein